MSVGLILLIILIIFLLGGFSGRFGGYGYGYGHGGVGVIGIILIIVVVLMLLGRIWGRLIKIRRQPLKHARLQKPWPSPNKRPVS